jgi:DNA-binding phage protein
MIMPGGEKMARSRNKSRVKTTARTRSAAVTSTRTRKARTTLARELRLKTDETVGRFLDEVRRRMERRRVSGAELARRMGISRAAVSRLLLPGSNPTLRTMAALADALNGEIEVVFHRPRPFSNLPPGLKLELNRGKKG